MQGGRIKVGMVASLTGQFRGQGLQALQGAVAWVGDTNKSGGITLGGRDSGVPLQLTYYDDESKAKIARAMTEKLINGDGVGLLLGPYSSVLTMASAPVAEEAHRVLWNHGGASDRIFCQGYHWTVGILTPASRYLIGVLDMVRDMDPGACTLAILRSGSGSFPEAVASGVRCHASKCGFRVVFEGQFRSAIDDLPALLRAVNDQEPDILLGVGRIEDDLLLTSLIREKRVRSKAVALVVAGTAQFGGDLGSWAEGFMGPSQWEPVIGYVPDYGPSGDELAARHGMFRQGGGDYTMAQAYAAGLVAQRCVEEAGTLDSGALREVAGRLDFTTFYGRFRIDPPTGCQVGRSVVIVQWQGNKKVVVWPKKVRQAEPIYPMADWPGS